MNILEGNAPLTDEGDPFDWSAYNQKFHKRGTENDVAKNKGEKDRSIERKEKRRRNDMWNETEKVKRKSNRSLRSGW